MSKILVLLRGSSGTLGGSVHVQGGGETAGDVNWETDC